MKSVKENLQQIHILIIGSGIIGKFNAVELSKLGYKITISDPNKIHNSSTAALGLLMGKIYQKRSGRSWELRKKSLELWPKWIKTLQKYNKDLIINKPLMQLTTNEEKFENLKKFVLDNPNDNLQILEKDSIYIQNIKKIFNNNDLSGIISFEDGRIDPKILLNTLDNYLLANHVNIITDEVLKIKKIKNNWISTFKKEADLLTDLVIVCNSLDSLKLINKELIGINLKPVLGQALEISCDDKAVNFLSLPKHFSINNKNLIPISNNKLIIGSTDEYNQTKTSLNKLNELIEFINEKPKWLTRNRISNTWFGIRSRPEGMPSPILKSIDKGLILCTGFYKNGILLAPACSQWTSNEIKKHI